MIAYAEEGKNHLKPGYHPELCRLGNLLHEYLGMQTAKTHKYNVCVSVGILIPVSVAIIIINAKCLDMPKILMFLSCFQQYAKQFF